MYGVDWHVIKRADNYENFKKYYIEVLKDGNLFNEEDIENFLGGNSLRFLGLERGGKSRKRLEKFYKENGIEKPQWFKVSS